MFYIFIFFKDIYLKEREKENRSRGGGRGRGRRRETDSLLSTDLEVELDPMDLEIMT